MSISKVLTTAFQKKQAEKQSASVEYRDLLHKHATTETEEWSDGDEKRLLELVEQLHITHEQAMKDAAIVAQMFELQSLSVSAPAKSKAYEKAEIAKNKAYEDRQRIFAEQAAKATAAMIAHDEAWDALSHAQKAKGLLNDLIQQHPHLTK